MRREWLPENDEPRTVRRGSELFRMGDEGLEPPTSRM
jgi:hypothetical protein